MKKSTPIIKCHRCPFFNIRGLEADSFGVIVFIKGTCMFYDDRKIEQDTPIKPVWCRVNKATAEEDA